MKWHRGTPNKRKAYLVWIDHGQGGWATVLNYGEYGWNGTHSDKYIIDGVVAWVEIEPPNMNKPLQPLPEYSQSEGD